MQLQQVAPVKDTALKKIVVWEAFDVTDPMTLSASKLYEKTLAADERIPWMWIEQSVQDRTKSKPRPGGWIMAPCRSRCRVASRNSVTAASMRMLPVATL